MEEGAVDALVSHLCPPTLGEGEGPVFCEYEVEKDAAFALGLLAVKVIHLLVRVSFRFRMTSVNM